MACFLAFALILRTVLKHLDPSKAVPKRVREALDNLAEGLLILDTKDQILLANTAFASVAGIEPEKLTGVPAPFAALASRRTRKRRQRILGPMPCGNDVRYRTCACS